MRESAARRWGIALIGATMVALLIATQNHYVLARAGRPMPWGTLALGELPVWYAWLAMSPAIIALTRRFPPLGARLWRNLALHLAAALAATLLMVIVTTAARLAFAPALIPATMSFGEAVRRGFTNSFVVFLPIYGIIVAALLAFRFYRDTQARAMRESQLEAALARARLDSLRAQLHPHFLFNTLHAISALMGDDVVAARKMMRRLSELLRMSLEDGAHEVPLAEELSLLEQYVEIQRIRFGDRLDVRCDIAPEARRMHLPRLLLQPLVENAIKHGTAGHRERGEVSIEATAPDGRLRIRVRDNGRGLPAPDSPLTLGVGLRNTEARLRQLYGDDFALRLSNHPSGGAIVEVEMPGLESPRVD